MSYKGWTNRETWELYLWLTNDERTTLAKPAGADISFYSSDIFESPEGLRAMVNGVFEKLQEEYFVDDDIADILEVDWRELAAAFMTEQA